MYLANMNYLEVQEYLKKSDTIVIPVPLSPATVTCSVSVVGSLVSSIVL